MALLISVAYSKPVDNAAAEEVDDLETAQQFYPGFYNGGFGGFGGGYGGYGGHGGYYREYIYRILFT